MLKYLHIKELKYRWFYHTEKPFDGKNHPHLKELVVDNVHSTLNELEFFVKKISNLQRLAISASSNKDIIDADRWERLITSLLPQLDSSTFKRQKQDFIYGKVFYKTLSLIKIHSQRI